MTKNEITINDNSNGWGPSKELVNDMGMPFVLFNKSERLGKIADWTAPTETKENTTNVQRKRHQMDIPTPTPFNYQPNQEDASFSVVDRASASKFGMKSLKSKSLQRQPMLKKVVRYAEKQPKARETSIKIKDSWKLIDELDFFRMADLSFYVEGAEDMYVLKMEKMSIILALLILMKTIRDAVHGMLNYYDKSYDKITTKAPKKLAATTKVFVNPTASDDAILKELAENATEKSIIATDTVLAALMCSPRSIYSWDIIISKKGNQLIFDKRSSGVLDYNTVNENAAEPPVESTEKDTNINSHEALASEATQINRNFSQQVVSESTRVVFSNPHPFIQGDSSEAPSTAYRYRKWDLDDITLYARTKLDAAMTGKGESAEPINEVVDSSFPLNTTQFIKVIALNEFDSHAVGSGGAPDWTSKLDTQRGAVIASEMKNNSNKLARWTTEAILAGCDYMRLGFVSRSSVRDRKRHQILGTTLLRPEDFAEQINLNIGNGWGIIKAFADICYDRLSDGKFILMRDPTKPLLRLYQVSVQAAEPIEIFEEAFEEDAEDVIDE
ncbi:hypothetical protein HK103_007325 [Boothiomyces macroporosus]|uniref:Eukaryotic translation initiation factor 3 subunit D n=1 Tax=Boothiomyces macroporosus TaxID=261099 RepID=A0AAD5UQ25_9FUNG|nr:hypothetical protein HK103_007325 [Boothiomyces macroporosus]